MYYLLIYWIILSVGYFQSKKPKQGYFAPTPSFFYKNCKNWFSARSDIVQIDSRLQVGAFGQVFQIFVMSDAFLS